VGAISPANALVANAPAANANVHKVAFFISRTPRAVSYAHRQPMAATRRSGSRFRATGAKAKPLQCIVGELTGLAKILQLWRDAACKQFRLPAGSTS
jgi:hypothetical protein